jgi:molecular chaperone HscB
MNYFELLGLEESFNLDKNELRRSFLEKSREVHPDLQSFLEVQDLEQSSYINVAYETLSNPNSRLKYILELNSIPLDAKSSPLPQDFLMDMMEINEEIELAKDDVDMTHDMKHRLDQMQSDLEQEYKPLLDGYSATNKSEDALLNMRAYYLKQNYIRRMHLLLESSQEI